MPYELMKMRLIVKYERTISEANTGFRVLPKISLIFSTANLILGGTIIPFMLRCMVRVDFET